jgi:hypothetical protein
MANKNTRQLRKDLSKERAALRRDGRQITSPHSKRTSPWRGAPNRRAGMATS